MGGQLTHDELRHRDGSLFVVLWGGFLEVAADLDHGLSNVEPSTLEVEVANAQAGELAPAKTGVSEHVDQQSESLAFRSGVDRGGEGRNLLVREELLPSLHLSRELKSRGGIARQTSVVDSKLQRARENGCDLMD